MTDTSDRLYRVAGHSHAETTLIWWIDSFRLTPGNWYRWTVAGRLDDTAYPNWTPEIGSTFFWRVPNLRGGGGRYVFALKPTNE